MNSENLNKFLVTFYSSLFIFTSILLLLKISPLIFLLFNFLPLLLISSSTSISNTFLSYTFSISLLFLLFNFDPSQSESLSIYFLINICFVFFLSFILTSFFKYNSVNNIKNYFAKSLSYSTITVSILLFIFFKVYFFEINFDTTIDEIKKIYLSQIKDDKKIIDRELTNLINLTINIIPSINCVFYLALSIFNLLLAQKIMKNLDIKILRKITFNNFEVPNWFFFITVSLLVLTVMLNDQPKIISLNIFLTFSFLIITKGLLIFLEFLKRRNLSISIKFLLLFLLFIFFSYLLVLFLFILGVFEQLKKIYNESLKSGN